MNDEFMSGLKIIVGSFVVFILIIGYVLVMNDS